MNLNARPLSAWAPRAWRGVGPKYATAGTIRVIKTANVRAFELAETPEAYVTKEFAARTPRALIPANALLVTATGVGSAGRACVNLGEDDLFADGHVTILPVDDRLVSAYLCAYLQSPAGLQQLISRRRGSSRQIEIYPEDILSVLVPALPRDQQDEIARQWLTAAENVRDSASSVHEAEAVLASFVEWPDDPNEFHTAWWTEAASALVERRRMDAESLRPSLARMREQVRLAGSIPLSDLVVTARKGLQPAAYVDDGGVVVIKSKDVRFPSIDLDACARTSDDDWPFTLDDGEVLINMTGEGSLGRAGVFRAQANGSRPTIPSVDLHALEVDRSRVLPEYLALYLNSEQGRRLTVALQTGSSGQQHLYPAHFRDIEIPMRRNTDGSPDLAWQGEIVAITNARAAALAEARSIADELNYVFLKALGIDIDLSVVPT